MAVDDWGRNMWFSRVRANDLMVITVHGMQAGSTLVYDDVSDLTIVGMTAQEDDDVNAGAKKM